MWPKQKKLAKLYFNILADDLEKDMAAVNRQAASWFASHRLRGGMAWLNVILKLPQYQVSSELFRIMLSTATLVLVGVCRAFGAPVAGGTLTTARRGGRAHTAVEPGSTFSLDA